MGYTKDNLPGSPAAFQRTKVARYVTAYSIVAAALFYAFSPFARAHRQAVKEGAWDQPDWMKDWAINLNQTNIKGIPTRKQIEKALEDHDRLKRGDLMGPDLLKKSQEQQPEPTP